MSEQVSLSIAEKLKEAGLHSIVYGLGSIFQAAVGFILLPILTGTLTTEEFGVYSLILMSGTVASAVFYLGMTSALPRSYFDYEQSSERRAVFTTAFTLLLFGALLQTSIGSIWGEQISLLLVGDSRYGNAVFWGFFGSSVAFINQYFFAYLRLLRKSVASVAFSLISLIGGVGLTLFLLPDASDRIEVPFKAIAYSQLTITLLFLGLYSRQAFIFRIESREIKNLLLFGIASVFASFGHMLLEWSDRLMIERYMTLTDVGAYSAAYRVGMLINVFLILPFSQIWNPMMMEYRLRSNIKALFTQVFSYFMIVGMVIITSATLFSVEILNLLVRSGLSSSIKTVFIVSMFACLAYGATNILVAGLFYERKVFLLPYIYYGVACLKIGLNVILIPIYGIVGAASSAVICSVLVSSVISMFARKYFSFTIEWARLLTLAVVCTPAIVFSLSFSHNVSENLLIKIALLLLTLAGIYNTCFSVSERASLRKGMMLGKLPRPS